MLHHVAVGVCLLLLAYMGSPTGGLPGQAQENTASMHVNRPEVAIRSAPAEQDNRDKKDDSEPPPVPEPITLAVVGSGLLVLSFVLRNREKREPRGASSAR